jgi:dTDP-4-amino-4,6-dideoxygalactose transaminase
MRKNFLPFNPPAIGEEEIAEVVDTLRSDWITRGPKTQRFEKEFAEFVGAPGALGLNSWTSAGHTLLVASGIGPGDEVITTPMTFCASVNIIEHVGATPVLVDIEPDTLNIDPVKVEAAITSKTRMILPVHYAGHPVELDSINQLAKDHELAVFEDAAHSVPAKYKGKMIGSHGNPVAYSFYATKNLTTAEGGMLVADKELLDRARVISLHGMSRNAADRYSQGGSWFYEVEQPGFKYNMTDIQASLGLVQMRRLADLQSERHRVVAKYQAAFAQHPALEIPTERQEVEHAWHLYVLRLRPEVLMIGRDQFIEELKACNIGISVHFIPVHLHPYYRNKYGFQPDDFPVAHGNFLRMLSLPLHPRLTEEDVNDVIEAVLDTAQRFTR